MNKKKSNVFNYKPDLTRLIRFIKENKKSQKLLAVKLGMCPRSLWRKLRGDSQFTLQEIQTIQLELELPQQSVWDYFFNRVVLKK